MNNDRDREAVEMVADEAVGGTDLKLEEQEPSLPRKETNHPHLILIKPNEREAELDPDHDPPGWPDF